MPVDELMSSYLSPQFKYILFIYSLALTIMLGKTSDKRSTLFSSFIGWINHVICTLKYSARSTMPLYV